MNEFQKQNLSAKAHQERLNLLETEKRATNRAKDEENKKKQKEVQNYKTHLEEEAKTFLTEQLEYIDEKCKRSTSKPPVKRS